MPGDISEVFPRRPRPRLVPLPRRAGPLGPLGRIRHDLAGLPLDRGNDLGAGRVYVALVHPAQCLLRPLAVLELDFRPVPEMLFQIVPKVLVQALVERSRAHLLEVEPTVQNRRERRVHVVADWRAVRPHLVPVHEPAEHVPGPETVRQKAVRPSEERALVPLADVLWQRNHNVSHHHRVLAHGPLALGLGPLVDALDAPLDRGPVRLHPLHRLHQTVGWVERERVVHPDPRRVDVLPLQAGRVAAVMREHVAYRCCLVLLKMRHKSKTFQPKPDFSRLKSSMLAFCYAKDMAGPALHPLGRSPRDPPALARSRLRSRPSGHRRERRTEGLCPSEPPLNLPAIWHTAHGTIRGAVVVAPLTPFHVCQIHSRLGQGKGRWELALTSTLFPVWSSASPARQFRSR